MLDFCRQGGEKVVFQRRGRIGHTCIRLRERSKNPLLLMRNRPMPRGLCIPALKIRLKIGQRRSGLRSLQNQRFRALAHREYAAFASKLLAAGGLQAVEMRGDRCSMTRSDTGCGTSCCEGFCPWRRRTRSMAASPPSITLATAATNQSQQGI